MRNHQHVQSRRTRRLAVAACLTVAGALGTAVGIWTLSSDDDPASPSPAAAVPSPPAPVIGRRADAAERWAAAHAARDRLEVCTANPISADALERCIEGRP